MALGLSSQASAKRYTKIQTWRWVVSKYEVIIYWSGEDNAYIAEVPELPGVGPAHP